MDTNTFSRRNFIKTASAGSLATLMATPTNVFAGGSSERIRVGVIGLGGRGTRAGITDCAEADPTIELVAIGDLFEDHLKAAPGIIEQAMERRGLPFKNIYKVTPDRMFHGFDAYKRVIECDVDMIILTAPPVFRPIHFKAAVAAGKHVFVEKPVAVDPVGLRDFIETAELAKKKGLTVVAGTQMRRALHIKALVEQVRSGAVGDIHAGQSFRMGGALSNWREDESVRLAKWSDMEWQLRRWLFTVWSSGDFLVEQHVHNLDIIDWLMGSRPVKALGFGGRQSRVQERYPNVWDHISIEYEYENGARITHIGSQIDGLTSRNDMRLNGDKGTVVVDFAKASIDGKNPWTYKGDSVKPQVQQYRDMLDAIRNSKPLNEGKQVADSTATAILGRMAAYSGRNVSWKWLMNASKLDITPAKWAFGDKPLPAPAVPGEWKLV
ncbi:MAG: Gfo/Idh/MocA family protein [Puniceicoccaceae bacterium]